MRLAIRAVKLMAARYHWLAALLPLARSPLLGLLLQPLLAGAEPESIKLQVMVVSEWDHLPLRMRMRSAFESCLPQLDGVAVVEVRFFMGRPEGTDLGEEGAAQEAEAFGDMVVFGGPDRDYEAPAGHAVYLEVKERVAALAERVVQSMGWLLRHRPDLDYVAKLADDSFANLPRLIGVLAAHGDPALALGRFMETPLTVLSDVENCETCPGDAQHEHACLERLRTASGGLEYRGCVEAAQRCCPASSERCTNEELDACLLQAQRGGIAAAIYYGTSLSPRWPHGAGWVLGWHLVQYLALNAEDLRMRGMPDMLLGFWLVSLEDVKFVDLPEGVFYQPPTPSHAAESNEECPPENVVIAGGLDADQWSSWFDAQRCELRCS